MDYSKQTLIDMKYTPGDWIYNPNNCTIESTTKWLIEPNIEDEEDGIPIQVISTYAAMGGDNPDADIQLICTAPKMLELLQEIVNKYDNNKKSPLTTDDISKIKEVVNLAIG